MRALFLAVLLLSGCGGRTTIDVPGPDPVPDAGPPPPTACEVDLLLVVDDSSSMGEEQAALAAALPSFLAAFDDPAISDPPIASVQIGVVTSDLGSGGFALPTCDAPRGTDGVLQTSGATTEGCLGTYPRFLTYYPGAPSSAPETTGRDLGCLTARGTDGCGFEQPLEAALEALTPASSSLRFDGRPGHGEGANAGFLRPESILAIVVVSDEDDCSVADPGIFDPADLRFDRALNVRCGVDTSALQPLERYLDGFGALRARHPSRLLVASIAGVPVDLVADPARFDAAATLEDPRMQAVVDPDGGNRLLPACDLPELGAAGPARRYAELAGSLGDAGLLQSICQTDLSRPLRTVAAQLRRIAASGCDP
jgi:hypothetical protein